jgi:EpsI family protein
VTAHLRFGLTVILLGAAAFFLHARSRNEAVLLRQPLAEFPRQLGNWTGIDVGISRDVLDVLGSGDFLMRSYQNSTGSDPELGLFLAYFPNQKTGDTIHSPKNCLPGAGWSPVDSSRILVSLPGHAPFEANRYIISKGDDRQLVLYWYWAHDRAVASEYWAKFYLIADSIRLNRSDGSLVRLSTPLLSEKDEHEADRRLLSFAAYVVPLLNQYVPR